MVSAESQSADFHVKECNLLLETLKDAAEQACTTWSEAHDQIGTIFAFIRILMLTYCILSLFLLFVIHLIMTHFLLLSDTDSDESSSDA